VGIELANIDDEELASWLREAWQLIVMNLSIKYRNKYADFWKVKE